MQAYMFRFAQPWVLFILFPLIVVLILIKLKWNRVVCYQYGLSSTLAAAGKTKNTLHRIVFFMLRSCVLAFLALIIARPQLVDTRSQTTIEGIDIVLVMDVSGSMQFRDYEDDKRSRIEVAKDEAMRFVKKRNNDAIGLVLFGNDALSRCPLTNDKAILNDIITQLDIGVIDADGTLLSRGMLTAVNRLKKSKAKSKVMILLTDGEPSEGDLDPKIPLEAAKQLGIKIYTIGIGSDEDSYFMHPFYGAVAKPKINKQLLTALADQTGGKFLARNSQDMRDIYDTIDQLETIEYETPVFSKTYDIFTPLAYGVFALILIFLSLSTFVWYGL